MSLNNYIKLSLVIPMYNVEKYIKKCLESIICQLSLNIEIIVINDGSTDSSLDIVKHYQEKMKIQNLRILSHENTGLAFVRNEGIYEAKGEYIWFIDSDDYIHSDILDNIIYLLNKKTPDVIEIGYDIVDLKNKNNYKRIIPLSIDNEIDGLGYLKKTLLNNKDYQWMPWKYIFKRKLFLDLNLEFPSGKKYEDIYVFPELIIKSNKVITILDRCYIYIYHRQGAITNEYSLKSELDKQYALKHNFDLYKNNEAYSELLNNLSYLYYSSIINGKCLIDSEWQTLLKNLRENLWIIDYTKSGKQVLIKYLIKIFGIEITSKLLNIRRILKNG